MDDSTCNMCGSPDVKREGNYYICNSCGSKYKSSDFNELSSNERILTEGEKAELECLKAYLEKDYSLEKRILELEPNGLPLLKRPKAYLKLKKVHSSAKRILELEPNNWLAYWIEHGVNDRWFELLRDSGMTQKEIEKALTVYYYEKGTYDLESEFRIYGYDEDLFDRFKVIETLNSKCLRILSILGEEYSELTKSWQENTEKIFDEYEKKLKIDRKKKITKWQ